MTKSLLACRAGDRVVVEAVLGGAARVDRLAAIGILPGVELHVQQTRPVVVVASDETVLAIDREVAKDVVALSCDVAARRDGERDQGVTGR